MADAIQPTVGGNATPVATGVTSCKGEDDNAELVLNARCHCLTVALYKADYLDFFDAIHSSAMFCDGRNKVLFDRRCTTRDMEMGARKRRWNVIKLCCLGFKCPVGSFDMPFVRNDQELYCLRNMQQVIARASDFGA